jgi:hypothetical protein
LAGVFGFVPLSVACWWRWVSVCWSRWASLAGLQLGLVVGVFVIGQMLEGSLTPIQWQSHRLRPVCVLPPCFAGGAGRYVGVSGGSGGGGFGVIVRSVLHNIGRDFMVREPEA